MLLVKEILNVPEISETVILSALYYIQSSAVVQPTNGCVGRYYVL